MEAGPEQMVFIRLLAAHLLADFFFQPYRWIRHRTARNIRSRQFWYHIGIVALLTWLFLGVWDEWMLPLFIAVTHLLIDWWKSTRADSIGYFLIDQAAHLIILILGWLWYSYGISVVGPLLVEVADTRSLWITGAAVLIVTRPIGFLIDKMTINWRKELPSPESNGLRNAGTWIGYLERLLILAFILLGELGAIGFLIAAKSIFRFSGREHNSTQRKQAEYILIGTLISFAMAIGVGLGALYLL